MYNVFEFKINYFNFMLTLTKKEGKMEENILHKLWEHELIILDEFVRICKKHNLQYFLMWGTLIGAVRHGGFIPWDDDIDVCMPREEYKKFLKIAPSELGEKFFLQYSKTDKYTPAPFAKIRLNNTAFYEKDDDNFKRHRGIFIDIIPLDSRKQKEGVFYKIKRKIATTIKNHIVKKLQGKSTKHTFYLNLFPCSLLASVRDKLYEGKGDYYESWGFVFAKSDFDPAVELEFCGKKYSVPKNYDSVLTNVYGNYMELPPEDKRVAHFPEVISFDLEKDNSEVNNG